MGLLVPEDPPPFQTTNLNGRTPVLLICDHASNVVPSKLNNLGLDSETLYKHIGWDIGAAKITLGLSDSLDATAILAGYSRLVVDANRKPYISGSIPEDSDGIVIPGNKDLSKENLLLRINECFWPYHKIIFNEFSKLRNRGKTPTLFSIHTFTPSMNGKNRPWHIGILWNRDPRIAKRLIFELRNHPDELIVGDNLPYSGNQFAYSLDTHAATLGLPNCAVEIRQDLANTDKKVSYWVKLLSETLTKILRNSEIQHAQFY